LSPIITPNEDFKLQTSCPVEVFSVRRHIEFVFGDYSMTLYSASNKLQKSTRFVTQVMVLLALGLYALTCIFDKL
jgi:hypothetical protein